MSGADPGTLETWAADRVSTHGLCWQLKAQPECPSEQGRSNIVFSDCLRSHRASGLPSMSRPCFSRGQPQSTCTRGRASGKSSSHACRRDSPSPVGGQLSSSLSRSRHFFPGAWGFCGATQGWMGYKTCGHASLSGVCLRDETENPGTCVTAASTGVSCWRLECHSGAD